LKQDIELYKEFLKSKNDNTAFESIMDKYRLPLIYFIQRYVKVLDIAEDIAQDVFVYILINKKEYDFKYSLKTYLYTIAKSRALNYLKREKRIVAINENQIFANEELEEVIFSKEKSTNLRKAVNRLSAKYQPVIYLADIENLKYKEICKVLNVSLPQVKVLLHRARKKLKIILESEVAKYEG
jgi:RNA polymerase sigma-70 factor (ECF subfamily)